MPSIDYSRMTAAEKYELVDEILASIKPEDDPLTAEQEAEIDRRLATLDEDIKGGRDAADVSAELRRLYL
jgi:putative addiction module component (TIGR02574 family)